MKQDDKPLWGPVGALLARVGFPFAQWPFRAPADFRPVQVANGPDPVNDDTYSPPPEVA